MVDKKNRDELKRTPKHGFILLDDDHVIFVDTIAENFEKVEEIIGDLKGIEASGVEDKTVENLIKFLINKIDTMALDDEHIDCLEESKKLNVVIKELRKAIKDNKGKIEALKIDDEHVDVVSKKKKLNIVLKDLEDKDISLETAIDLLKRETDRNHADFTALNKIVDNSTERDKVANDKHYEFTEKIKKLIG